MGIYGLADLHLSLSTNKPMDIFGFSWQDHVNKIENNWKTIVQPEDLVLIPGDISWAMNFTEAEDDLAFLNNLPGQKLLLKGNHDYWWSTMDKLKKWTDEKKWESLHFLKNNAFLWNNTIICGTRGWVLPGETDFTPGDQKIYLREAQRLELSLKAGLDLFNQVENSPALPQKSVLQENLNVLLHSLQTSGYSILAMLHYPPINVLGQDSLFSQLLEKYQVNHCVYGHLHGRGIYKAFQETKNNVAYQLISADHLQFSPFRLETL